MRPNAPHRALAAALLAASALTLVAPCVAQGVAQDVAQDAASASAPAPATTFRSEEVSIPVAEGISLGGTLSFPEGEGPFPAIVLLTGSGAQDRDSTIGPHKSFIAIAERLNREGVAVLRCDDRGVGASTGSFADMTTLDQGADGVAQMAFLRARPDIDAARVGIFGHSEGGVAACVAAGSDPATAFLVLMASPGVTGRPVLHSQLRAMLAQAGFDEAQLDESEKLQGELFDLIAARAPEEQIAEGIRALAKQQFKAATGQEPQPMQMEMIVKQQLAAFNRDWMRVFMTLDPAEHLAKVTAPTLVLAAERDVQVVPDLNVPPITAALEKAGNTRVTVMRQPDHNHLFQHSTTGSPAEYMTHPNAIEAPVTDAIARWVAEAAAAPAAPAATGDGVTVGQ